MYIKAISRFLDRYDLPWLMLAVITWLVILLTCNRKQFLHALPVGLWTMVVGTVLEQFFIVNKFWVQRFIMIHIGELDLFVSLGPFFGIGILMIRFLPEKNWPKLLLLLFISGIAAGIEMISIKFGFLAYHLNNWNILYSLIAYFLALMSALGFHYIYNWKKMIV